MRVRMRVQVSGTRNGASWPPLGAVLEVPDQEGAELCAGGIAEPVATFEEPETAVVGAQAEERSGALTEENSAALVRAHRVRQIRPGK